MRWSVFAISWLWLVCSVFGQDGEPSLEILTRTSVLDVGVKRALYCQVQNMDESIPIVWISPQNKEVPVKQSSADTSRVYVELKTLADKNKRILVLYFFPPHYEDSGVWTCKAGEFNQSCDIVVGQKIKLKVAQSEVHTDEGRNVKLKCEGFGAPEPVIHWYKDNVPLPEDQNNKYVWSKSRNITYTLEIKNTDFQDSGTYMCKVTQKALSHYTNNTIRLFVHHKPIPYKEDPDSSIDVSTGNNLAKMNEIYAIMDEEKNITCRVFAYPPPVFKWYKLNKRASFDQPIVDEDRVFTDENTLSSTLKLSMRSEEDVTMYKCVVSNTKGSLTISFDVNIAERPPPPTSISFVEANSSFIKFKVVCENCTLRNASDERDEEEDPANLPIIGYDFELAVHQEEYLPDWLDAFLVQVDIDDPDNTVFEVGGLSNLTSYHVRVASRNKGGRSTWLELAEVVTTSKSGQLVVTFMVLIMTVVLLFSI